MITVLIIVNTRPFDEVTHNRLEMLNDYTVFECALLLYNFTPYLANIYSDPISISTFRTNIGWVVIGLVILMIVIN